MSAALTDAQKLRLRRCRKLADLLFVREQLGPDDEVDRLIAHFTRLLRQP